MARNVGFSGGSILAPLLIKVISEAVAPKEGQKQLQRQMALEALAGFYPTVSKMPTEEKEKFYREFFPAYGVYHPKSSLRRLFGAGPEPVLPLPKGATTTREFMPWPFKERTIYTLPQREPFSFRKPPIFSEEDIAEMKSRGMGEEDISEAFETKVTGVKPPPSTKTMRKVARLRAAGQAIPPDLEEEYNTLMRQKEIEEETKKSLITAREEKTKLGREELERKKARDARLAQQFDMAMAFNREKLASVDQQHREMMKSKGVDRQTANYINMFKVRVDSELKAMAEHNKREQHSKDLDPGYVPMYLSSSAILAQWDDLYAKVMSFRGEEERVPAPHPGAQPGGSEMTPPPAPRGSLTPKDQLINDLWRK